MRTNWTLSALVYGIAFSNLAREGDERPTLLMQDCVVLLRPSTRLV